MAELTQYCDITARIEFKNRKKRTFRGDYFGQTQPEMMVYELRKMCLSKLKQINTIRMYDNRKSKAEKIIFDYAYGVVAINRLEEYLGKNCL
jgi:hypothetical protein